MTEELRELRNDVDIVGILKSKNIEEKPTKAGDDAIMGSLVVEVNDAEGNTHNIRVSLFSKKFKKDGNVNGLFTGYKKVMDEFLDIDTFGRDQANMISVRGNVSGNDYVDKNEHLRSTNQIRGVFFNRLDNKEIEQHAYATIETVVTAMDDILDEDGPTGDKSVTAFTVGYNETVIQLQDVIIKSDIASQFETLYYPGTTGELTFKINNYPEKVTEDKNTEAESAGFGSSTRVENNSISNFVNNLQIIGGDTPKDDGLEFTKEQIVEVLKRRKQQLAEAKSSGSQPKQGFAKSEVSKKKQTEETKKSQDDPFNVSEDDIPDFGAF